MNPEERIVTWLISLGVLDSPKKTICDPEEFLKSSLKNGVVLCKLINRLRPGSIEKVREICSIFGVAYHKRAAIMSLWRFSIAWVTGRSYFNLFLRLRLSFCFCSWKKSENEMLSFSNWPPKISTVKTCYTTGARDKENTHVTSLLCHRDACYTSLCTEDMFWTWGACESEEKWDDL